MTDATSQPPIGSGRTAVTAILGILLAAAGLWGTVAIGRVLAFVWQHLADDRYPFTGGAGLYQLLWLAVALCVAAAGISLVIAAMLRKRDNLVPGPTLYFLGLALCGIGFFLLTFGQVVFGSIAVVAGLLLIYWEWTLAIT